MPSYLTEAQLDAACEWWISQLKRHPVQFEKDNEMMALSESMMQEAVDTAETPSDVQLDQFKVALREALLASPSQMVHCDYWPDIVLQEAADAADIDQFLFPSKAYMYFEFDNVRVTGSAVDGEMYLLDRKPLNE